MEPKIPARAELEGFIPFLTQQAQLQLSRLPWLRMEAEELIQRTMLEAWESLDSYRGDSEAQLAKWLQTILKRQLSRELRHVGQKCRDRKRVISLQLALEESSARLRRWVAADDSSVGQHAIRKERAVRLTAALEQLPAGASWGGCCTGMAFAGVRRSRSRRWAGIPTATPSSRT